MALDFWEQIKKPILALAPMAGYTDSAYRQVTKDVAPNVICFSEFTHVDALKYGNAKAMKMLDFEANEKPLIMQLFGTKVEFFVEAAKRLEDMGVAGIDINMGCPAKKVVASDAGSALLKDRCLAGEIVNTMSKAVNIPVSVKTRLGYDKYEEENFIKFCLHMQEAGAKLITLHGRTRKQAFSGEANWEPIYMIKKMLKIPVIGNGDIRSPQDALDKIGNLDGLMIGRASMGNPWLLAEVYAALNKEEYIRPPLASCIPLIKKHTEISVKMRGERYGILEMRKHLSSYISGCENASYFRQKLVRAETLEQVLSGLKECEKAL